MSPASLLPLADAALRGALIVLCLLLVWRLGHEHRTLVASKVGRGLLLGLAVQALGSLPVLEAGLPCAWQVPLVAVAVANSVLFWLLARALFDDGFVLRRRDAALWLVTALCAFGICRDAPWESLAGPWLRAGLRWLPLMFAVAALWTAARHWASDLVEPRRRLRAVVVWGGGVYTVVQAMARLEASHGQLVGAAALADVLALLLLIGMVAARLLRASGDARWLGASDATVPAQEPGWPSLTLPPEAQRPVTGAAFDTVLGTVLGTAPDTALDTPLDPADQRLAAALDLAMAPDSPKAAWRAEGLTLAALASRLAVPEYRLRRHINQRLGHRNFNAYVNGLRIAAAQQALVDPALAGRPILSIALDLGFASIGPFNRAFKAITGLTPGDFRQQAVPKRADS